MRLATLLVFSVILISLYTIPSVVTQTATTITSLLTSTGVFTFSSYSTVAVGSATLTATGSSTVIGVVNTLSVYGPLHCSWDYWNITVPAGTNEITGIVGPSSAGVTFYILTPQQYTDFTGINSDCSGYQGGEVEVESLTSAYSLVWPNPPAGFYYVLFYDAVGGPSYPITTPFYLVAASSQEQTSTIYSVAGTEGTVSITATLASLQTTQVSQPSSSPLSGIPAFPVESLVIGLLLGLAILLLRRSRKNRPG